MNEDDFIVREFLSRYPDAIVSHGPLYRVVDGQVMKGLYVVAHVQTGHGAESKTWEGVGHTVQEALNEVNLQIMDQADTMPDGRRISEMSIEELAELSAGRGQDATREE